MAPSKPVIAPDVAPSRYPAVEALVESASPEELAHFFDSVREGLESVKGPKAEYAKRVRSAVERTDELLAFLLETREKIAGQRPSRR